MSQSTGSLRTIRNPEIYANTVRENCLQKSVLPSRTTVQSITDKGVRPPNTARVRKVGSMNSTTGIGFRWKKEGYSLARSGSAALIVVFLVALALGLASLFPAHAAAAAQTLDNVQIQVQTTNSSLTSFYLTVYNSTGYPVVSSSSAYPGFGAMLPSGSYLFVVTATLPYPYCCLETYDTGSSSGTVSPSPATNGSSTGSAVIYPVKYPPVEYGYAMKEIAGADSFTIQTSAMADVPTSDVTVHVSYANGTAASGAYVSASIIGSYYYYPTANWVMWGQTGPDGSFTLKVPSLPLEVYAYTSIPVNLPKNLTTYVTTIGGEKVNVTAYWQPMYVYLEGYALIIPPQTSANITLHVQQPRYYVTPYGTGQTTPPYQSGTAIQTVTTVTTGAPQTKQPSGPTNQPQVIPPFGAIAVTTTVVSTSVPSFGTASDLILLGITVVAVAVAAFGMVLVLRRKR